MTRVISYGLGPIGTLVAKMIVKRSDMRIVGAIDVDREKAGRDLGELLGEYGRLGITVSGDANAVLEKGEADIVVLATASSLRKVRSQILQIVQAGLPVISTCEELAYPLANNPDLVDELDALARRHDVAIYGTGVNPGFIMDALALVLTTPCAEVTAVKVVRVQDARDRRLPFQHKIGAGTTRQEFEQRVASGSIRHVGFRESARMIADAIGWRLDDYQECIEPVVADRDISTPFMTVRAGSVAGLNQVGRAFVAGRERVRLDLTAYIGAPQSHDTVTIEGTPTIVSRIDGGLNGDIATAAVTVNSIPRVLAANGGLLTANNVPIPHWRLPHSGSTN
jgi:2,4-diaminopentanoate dehydrogenase